MSTSRLTAALTAMLVLFLNLGVDASVSSRLSSSLASLSQSPIAQDSAVRILVLIENQDLRAQVIQTAAAQDMGREMRLKAVVNSLKSYQSQKIDQIEHVLRGISSTSVHRHWISPALVATVPVFQLSTVSELDGVAEVVEDLPIEIESPVATSIAPSLVSAAVSSELGLLRVPEVWQTGLNGTGRLVCNFDTGVEGTHPALSAKWRGNHASVHASWFCPMQPLSQPFDNAGHGTHTMGTMIGSAIGDSFGVAPGAEWIAAGVVDQGADLNTTFSHILSAFEWALNPDDDPLTTDDVPDVILNSWGVPTIQPSVIAPCSSLFWQAIDNVEAAGVVVIFAAGNEGKLGPATVRNPANRATTPYNAFSVGAVDGNRVIADFSGRGPSSCDPTQIKPEVVAPGVSIRSSTKGGAYTYMTGTSMAAPYIAGLVAICRQYNPDATPEQIKYAVMMSAADLGVSGEDNDYGWGFPDAVRMLTYLPAPNYHSYAIARKAILGDGIARPGASMSIELMLTDTIGNQGQVLGRLTTVSQEYVTVSGAQTAFMFGDGGTTAVSVPSPSFSLSPLTPNGSVVWFWLHLSSTEGAPLDSITFSVSVGYLQTGTVGTISTGRISLTVSDFAQFGLDTNSLYNLGGQGFRLDNGDNLLYEAGVIVGRNTLQLASSIRDSAAQYRPSELRPIEQLSGLWQDADGAYHRTAGMDDSRALVPMPIGIYQDVSCYTESGDNGYITIEYRLQNRSLETQTGVEFGFMTDFDLSPDDRIAYRDDLDLIYQAGPTGAAVGIVAIDYRCRLSGITNGPTKRGFTNQQKFSLASAASSIDSMTTGDMMMILASGPRDIRAGDSAVVRFVLVAGADVGELITNAIRVRQKNNLPTTVDDPLGQLPASFVLDQNYPNPFNPSTTISFTLKTAGMVKLDVFDCLGRLVTEVTESRMAAGRHQIVWDARSLRGGSVASGVYFYRLTVDRYSESRKMLLLK